MRRPFCRASAQTCVARLPALLAERLKSDDEWIRLLGIREIGRWLADRAIIPADQEKRAEQRAT